MTTEALRAIIPAFLLLSASQSITASVVYYPNFSKLEYVFDQSKVTFEYIKGKPSLRVWIEGTEIMIHPDFYKNFDDFLLTNIEIRGETGWGFSGRTYFIRFLSNQRDKHFALYVNKEKGVWLR